MVVIANQSWEHRGACNFKSSSGRAAQLFHVGVLSLHGASRSDLAMPDERRRSDVAAQLLPALSSPSPASSAPPPGSTEQRLARRSSTKPLSLLNIRRSALPPQRRRPPRTDRNLPVVSGRPSKPVAIAELLSIASWTAS